MDNNKFERIKYWVEFAKWFLASVALVLTSSIVSWNFTSRDKSFEEVKFYSDKYMTELIVFNDQIGPRYKLAQFFKNVTVDKKQRQGWERYFEEVKEEFDAKQLELKEQAKLKEEFDVRIEKNDSLTPAEKQQFDNLKMEIQQLKSDLNAALKLPETRSQEELLFKLKVYIYNIAELEDKAEEVSNLMKETYGIITVKMGTPSWKLNKDEIVYFNSRQLNQCKALQTVLREKGLGEIPLRLSSGANDHASHIKLYLVDLK